MIVSRINQIQHNKITSKNKLDEVTQKKKISDQINLLKKYLNLYKVTRIFNF